MMEVGCTFVHWQQDGTDYYRELKRVDAKGSSWLPPNFQGAYPNCQH